MMSEALEYLMKMDDPVLIDSTELSRLSYCLQLVSVCHRSIICEEINFENESPEEVQHGINCILRTLNGELHRLQTRGFDKLIALREILKEEDSVENHNER